MCFLPPHPSLSAVCLAQIIDARASPPLLLVPFHESCSVGQPSNPQDAEVVPNFLGSLPVVWQS